MLLKSRFQEQDSDPVQDSGALFLLQDSIGEVDPDLRHKVASPSESMSLAETAHLHHHMAERQ